MTAAEDNWLESIRQQSDFHLQNARRSRSDAEFDWSWYSDWQLGFGSPARLLAKRALRRLPLRTRWNKSSLYYSTEWIRRNAHLLWGARQQLADDLSKLLFDLQLVLRATSHERYYFPRIDFDDFATVARESPFEATDLPTRYLGLPLRVFTLNVPGCEPSGELKVVSTDLQLRLLNSYRQYFIQRNGIDLSPSKGDVVFDCGACIGEIAMLFAVLVGAAGQVHLFDPVPLHARYCELQGKMNPALASVLHINTVAVGDKTRQLTGARSDSSEISPGGLAVDSFAMSTIDDYVAAKKLNRVDVIKMDIEGAEKAALTGAGNVIREFRPKLCISAYHLSDDLWKLPELIKSLNPRYSLYFGHHSPVSLESVYYAVDRS